MSALDKYAMNRYWLLDKTPEYPHQVTLLKGLDPDKVRKELFRGYDFISVPINKHFAVWGFETKEALELFSEKFDYLKPSLSVID